MPPLRIGVLGAARIAPAAIVRPARAVAEAEVTAVAARDRDRATAFAAKHGIERVVPGYEALVTDPDLDAVYIPLPNGLHGHWTRRALAAGKHVLCEKPFTANEAEAVDVAAAAAATPELVVMEAFHYRYHPLFLRVLQLLGEGAIGDVEHIDTWLCFPLLPRHDIRWQLGLAGGALMDAGCYTIHMLRHLAGAEPEVVSAAYRERSPGVDRFTRAHYRFADGRTATTTCSMLSAQFVRVGFRVRGSRGELRVFNPMAPNLYHRLVVRGPSGRHVERVSRRPTYEFQLEAFADAVQRGTPPITGLADARANMAVIDAVYRAAGLPVREPTPV
ncbi:MAG TPA: Gfo/Idh/MocA family oxidoreductase [Acidimicrobiales bacterium]|nr:Gfo/Idh/MocA family oxidoreductase [Acidimicrobiales bacterium]